MPRSGPSLLVLLLGQLVFLGLVVAYGAQRPWQPDGGLQQLDLLSLAERVPELPVQPGQVSLVVAAGRLDRGDCAEQVRRASRERDTRAGVDRDYPLVVLVPARSVPADLAGLSGLRLVADPGGRLARRLALPAAARGCDPGYAVVDAASYVRYRTYDPGWSRHSQEQEILLAAARR